MTSTQAIQQVTNASYQRELDISTAQTAVGTEYEHALLSDNVVAGATNELFSWVRMTVWFDARDTQDVVFWYVVKQKSTDGIAQVVDPTVLETLQKTGCLFARGALATGYGQRATKTPQLEFKQVKLAAGEELRFVYHDMYEQGTTGLTVLMDLEWRQTGV